MVPRTAAGVEINGDGLEHAAGARTDAAALNNATVGREWADLTAKSFRFGHLGPVQKPCETRIRAKIFRDGVEHVIMPWGRGQQTVAET